MVCTIKILKMIKKFALLNAFILFYTNAIPAQAPAIDFSKTYGGSAQDNGTTLTQTSDKGFLVAGYVKSNDGLIIGMKDKKFQDIWLVKTDSLGNTKWTKTITGTGVDIPTSLTETQDAYLIAGHTGAKDYDFSSNQHSQTQVGFIAWLNKTNGNIKQLKTYTGDVQGHIEQIKILDNKYIIAIGQNAKSKNSSGAYTADDLWIAKMDLQGNIIWEKYYGGTNFEFGSAIIPKTKVNNKDRGFLAIGNAASNDFDVKNARGANDGWVLNLDSMGNIIWAETYGGSGADWLSGGGEDITLTENGIAKESYLLVGSSESNDGDLSGKNLGAMDYWAIKIDGNGKLLWSKTYGGTDKDWARTSSDKIFTNDKGALIYGYTRSKDGDAAGRPNGTKGLDAFLIRIDKDGNKVWSKALGSTMSDGNTGAATITCDDGYAFTEMVSDISQDVTGKKWGSGEIWFCKLKSDGLDNANCSSPTSIKNSNESTSSAFNVYPNPAETEIQIQSDGKWAVQIIDYTGRVIMNMKTSGSKARTINITSLVNGLYIIHATNDEGIQVTQKLLKK